MNDRSDHSSHHERTLLPWSYISLLDNLIPHKTCFIIFKRILVLFKILFEVTENCILHSSSHWVFLITFGFLKKYIYFFPSYFSYKNLVYFACWGAVKKINSVILFIQLGLFYTQYLVYFACWGVVKYLFVHSF